VGHDERRLVLHIQVAAELQRADALDRVYEDGDGQQDVAERQLAAGEDGSRRDAELMAAALALEDRAALVLVDRDAAAVRADRIAVRGSPAQRPEGRPRLIIRHTRDSDDAERAGLGGEKEVLSHRTYPSFV